MVHTYVVCQLSVGWFLLHWLKYTVKEIKKKAKKGWQHSFVGRVRKLFQYFTVVHLRVSLLCLFVFLLASIITSLLIKLSENPCEPIQVTASDDNT